MEPTRVLWALTHFIFFAFSSGPPSLDPVLVIAYKVPTFQKNMASRTLFLSASATIFRSWPSFCLWSFGGQSFYTRGHHSTHWVLDQRTCVGVDGGERGRYCRSPLWEHPRTVPTRIAQVPTASRPYRLPLFQCLALTIKILRGLMP